MLLAGDCGMAESEGLLPAVGKWRWGKELGEAGAWKRPELPGLGGPDATLCRLFTE